MKKIILFMFFFILILISSCNNSNSNIETSNEITDDKLKFKIDMELASGYSDKKDNYKYGSIIEESYTSIIYNEVKHYNVILPYNYDSNKTYPLLITIPSLGESHNDYLKIIKIDNIVGNLIYEKKIQEVIVLIPNIFMGPNEKFSVDNMFFSDKSPEDINKCILPIIKEKYKISDIYMHGFSLGGRQAINYVLQFGGIKSVAVVEPFFYNKYLNINRPKIDNIYLIYGKKDGIVLTAPSLLHNELNAFEIEHEYVGVDFDHDFECSRQMLYKFLNTVLEVK